LNLFILELLFISRAKRICGLHEYKKYESMISAIYNIT